MISLWLASALAAPIGDGIQTHIHPAGFEFLSDQLQARSIAVGPLDFDSEVSCYELDVDGFNVDVQIQSVLIQPTTNGLFVDVDLSATSTYINVAGVSGWLDTCFDFDVLVELVELQNGHLQGELRANAVDGAVVLEFACCVIMW